MTEAEFSAKLHEACPAPAPPPPTTPTIIYQTPPAAPHVHNYLPASVFASATILALAIVLAAWWCRPCPCQMPNRPRPPRVGDPQC